jgi:hypothetical protein
VTPGQVLTLYEGDLVLGGGWIEAALDVTMTDQFDLAAPSESRD